VRVHVHARIMEDMLHQSALEKKNPIVKESPCLGSGPLQILGIISDRGLNRINQMSWSASPGPCAILRGASRIGTSAFGDSGQVGSDFFTPQGKKKKVELLQKTKILIACRLPLDFSSSYNLWISLLVFNTHTPSRWRKRFTTVPLALIWVRKCPFRRQATAARFRVHLLSRALQRPPSLARWLVNDHSEASPPLTMSALPRFNRYYLLLRCYLRG
jgi:hypothetical protein